MFFIYLIGLFAKKSYLCKGMKKISFIIGSFLLSLHAFAQPKISFDKESKDFGTVLWANPATAEFKVSNTGDALLVLSNVEASCACTAVEWPKNGIKPGETASIKAVFDAKALGTFYKEVEILCNASPEPIYLGMSGKVVANAEDVTSTEGFEVEMGDVRLSKDVLEFDRVSKGNDPIEEIAILNPTRAPFEPVLMHVPDYLEVSCYPERIPAGRTGRLRVKLLTDKIPNMGLTQTSVYFTRQFGDKVSNENEIPVSVILLPDFSAMSEASFLQAPKMQVSDTELTILTKGKLKGKATILVTNTGKSELKIDRLQVLSSAVSVSIPKKNVPAGQSIKMKVTLDKTKVKKHRRLGIIMITNDPEHSEQIIDIKTD